MSHCYLIFAHHQPAQVARLVGSLRHPGARFFLHVDAKSDQARFVEALEALPVAFVEPRVAVNWAGWSQVEAMLRLLSTALEAAPDGRRFTLLSGACYPVASNAKLAALEEQPHAFINARRIAPGDHGYDRISRYHLQDHPILNPRTPKEERRPYTDLRRYLEGFVRSLPDQPPLPIAYHKGSTWWSLPRDAAQHVVDFGPKHPEIVKIFHWAASPDESYFQTILANSPFADRLRRRLHYVDFSPESIKRGKVLSIADLPAIRESKGWFVRKVSPTVSAELLDVLDRERADD